MINRKPLIACALTLIMVAWLCFALPLTARMASADTFTGCRIDVADSLNTRFVTPLEVSQECDDIMQWIKKRRRDEVDLRELETRLRASDKVETVNVFTLSDGTLAIDVTPMTPVARVFDDRKSYYINSEGKTISADPRYHVDVPVVVGRFSEAYPPERLLPLLHYIASRPELDALVSTVKQSADGNLIIIPTIRGHVVNFGDTSMVADKFLRLREFYRQVMPVRGWDTYDTVAVRWRGQVVATRRDKALPTSQLSAVVEEFDDIDDTETMISPAFEADSVMPPVTKP